MGAVEFGPQYARATQGLAAGLAAEPDLERIAAEWDALADRSAAPPFRRPDWIRAWWHAFGSGKLETLTVRREGSLVGVLPMVRRRGALVSPTNWHTPEFGAVALDCEAETLLLRAAVSRGPRRTSLAFVEAGSHAANVFRETAEALGRRVLVRTIERSPFVNVVGSWEEFERGLSRNLRKDTRRCLRRLSELGPLSLDVQEGNDRLDELLAELFEAELVGWQGTHNSAIASQPATLRFYTAIAVWAARRGWLRLAFLRVADRPVAVQFALETQGVWYGLKGAFDAHFRHFSPGTVMTLLTLQRAFALGLTRYEFLGSDEPYKLRWTTTSHERALLQTFPRSVPGLAGWVAYAYGRPLVKRCLGLVGRS